MVRTLQKGEQKLLKLNKLMRAAALVAAGLSMTATAAIAENILHIQSILPSTVYEEVMLKDFGAMVQNKLVFL